MKSEAIRTITNLCIAPSRLIILAMSLKSFSMLKVIWKQDLYFLKLKAEDIRGFIASVLFELKSERAMAFKVASIYLTDPRRKV